MAVVSISKIQVRRGRKNSETGLPQLASGEFGWAIDTQELYIGNGSVSEGAPAVGNTKLLTEKDLNNIFDFVSAYEYKDNDATIYTGPDSLTPVRRSLQDRLDDRVSIRSFITTQEADASNYTDAIQRAIFQLFLNDSTKGDAQSRVVLYFEPGIYDINDTIYLPPYTTIIGAGKEKTIIRMANTTQAPIFKTINDESTADVISPDADSDFDNQSKFIHVEGLSLDHTGNGIGLAIQSCRNSMFKNIRISGNWSSGVDANSVGINVMSSVAQNTGNVFEDIDIDSFSYAVYSLDNMNTNKFNRNNYTNLYYGIVLESAEEHNVFENSQFDNIVSHGLWITEGAFNTSRNNHYRSVGYNGSDASSATKFSVIKIDNYTNVSVNDSFDRIKDLSYNQIYINDDYTNIYEGNLFGEQGFVHKIDITTSGTWATAFRLPGVHTASYEVDYVYRSVGAGRNIIRQGKMNISFNFETSSATLVDEYDFSGADINDAENLEFRVQVDGATDSIRIEYQNSTVGEDENSHIQFMIKTKQ